MMIFSRKCKKCGKEFMPGVFDDPKTEICPDCKKK
jgi:hypothetical protein